MARAERADRSKPYGRPRDGRSADAPGSWKHDLHPSGQSSSLAARLSGSASSSGGSGLSRPSLLSRISGGQGKELLPSGSGKSKLFGFGTQPPVNANNANAGLELLPSGTTAQTGPHRGGGGGGRMPRGFQAQPGQRSLVQNGFNAALGLEERNRRERRPAQSRELLRDDGRQNGVFGANEGVSILGAGKTTVLVRVANLAYGTTAEDVVSAFAPLPILNATVSSSPSSSLVSVDLELGSAQEANELISKYDGQIADGNKLSVTIVRQALKDRMSSGAATSSGSGLASLGGGSSRRQEPPSSSSRNRDGGPRGQELLSAPGSGKMYSDTILQSDPKAYIQTLAEERAEAERNRQRASAWSRNGGQAQSRSQPGRNGNGNGSLAARLGGVGGGGGRGGGEHRGRGTAGGMMVD